ncbi:hypothetical protein [Streptomyces sp. NPDC096105]|uniref:hypothetical protein n=1 Tax=Streptomyces sp. NPDC096105 TaxID=3366074 RepID=UPI003805D68F
MNWDSTHPIDDALLQPGPKWDYPNWPRDAETGEPLTPSARYARAINGELYRIDGNKAYPLDSGVSMIAPPVTIPPAE